MLEEEDIFDSVNEDNVPEVIFERKLALSIYDEIRPS